ANTGNFATYIGLGSTALESGQVGITAFSGYQTVLASATSGDTVLISNTVTSTTATTLTLPSTLTSVTGLVISNTGSSLNGFQVNPNPSLTIGTTTLNSGTLGGILTLGIGSDFLGSVTGDSVGLAGDTAVFANATGGNQTRLNGPFSGAGDLAIAGNQAAYMNTAVNSYTGG